MIPSETSLKSALDALSPGEFQRIGEIYARTAYPLRFARLSIRGRNVDVQTTAGWPDAYAIRLDGKVDALEVTRDNKNWRRHLEDDIKKAASVASPGVGGFLFIAWARTPSPETLSAERQALVNLGVAPDAISFVFREELVANLSTPAHALTWRLLGLRTSSWPFANLDAAHLFGDDTAQLTAPTRAEIQESLQTASSSFRRVCERLASVGSALVIGQGAAGKTVLATSVGVDWEDGGRPCYYLDLAPAAHGTAAMTASALDAMTSRSAENVLFIVDNVHRDEHAASALFEQWLQINSGAKLLMLGRAAGSANEMLGRVSPLELLSRTAIELKVDTDTILAVWKRLSARTTPDQIAQPPGGVLRTWLKMFAGDLIALSAAVSFRKPSPPHWTLAAEDARGYVVARYLEPLTKEEKHELLSVAEWSTLELARPENVTDSYQLLRLLQDRVVERSPEADGGYRTQHPGVAELLLSAAGVETYHRLIHELRGQPLDLATTVADRLVARQEWTAAYQALEPHLESYADALALLTSDGASRLTVRAMLLQKALGTRPLESAPAESAGVLLDLAPELQVSLGIHCRKVPGLAGELNDAWLALDSDQQGQLATGLAVYAINAKVKTMPLVVRWIRQSMPVALPLVLRHLTEANGIERFFSNQRRLSQGRWDDFLRASEVSSEFRDRLLAVLGTELGLWPLLTAPDASRLLASLRARDPDLADALLSHVSSSAFHKAAVRRSLDSGPGPFLSLLQLASAYDRRLLSELVEVAQGERWLMAVERWRRARTKYPRLKSWATANSPALATAIAEAEEALAA